MEMCRALEELYSNAYLYVLPSDIEGMPMSLLEALSFGNVCLANFLCDKDFNRGICALMEEIAHEAKRYNGLDRKIAVNRLLNRLVRRYGTVPPSKKESKAGEIIKYVYQNYDSPELGLETIAEHFHYAPVTISRLFGKFIRCPDFKY